MIPHHSNAVDDIKALLCHESSYLSVRKINVNQSSSQHIYYRSKVLGWVKGIAGYFLCDPQIVMITMDYIDRYSLHLYLNENFCFLTYQLVSMSSLYLALIFHEGDNFFDKDGTIQPKSIVSLARYAELSSGSFTPNDIASMGQSILHTLKRKMQPVTSITFVNSLLQLIRPIALGNNTNSNVAKSVPTIMDYPAYQKLVLGRYLLHELAFAFTQVVTLLPESTPYFHFVASSGSCRLNRDTFAPSTVAYASIILSMEALTHDALPVVLRNQFLEKCLHLNSDLNPDRTDIQELKRLIQKHFQPERFTTLSTSTKNIAIQHCGILEPTFFKDIAVFHTDFSPDGDIRLNNKTIGFEGNAYNTISSDTRNDKHIPRAVIVNLESTMCDSIRTEQHLGLTRPEYVINGKEDAANSNVHAHYAIGEDIIDNVIKQVCKMSDDSGAFQDFLIFHSTKGDTSSSSGSQFLERLAAYFNRKTEMSCTITPSPQVSTIVVESYNVALSIHSLLKYSDPNFKLNTEELYKVCRTSLDSKPLSYVQLNKLIADVISSLTTSLRFYGSFNGYY